MLFLIGFAIGLFYGCFLWWQQMKDHDVLWEEHTRLLKEIGKYHGPTTRPSNN